MNGGRRAAIARSASAPWPCLIREWGRAARLPRLGGAPGQRVESRFGLTKVGGGAGVAVGELAAAQQRAASS